MSSFTSVLIANRGEIACRIARGVQARGLTAIAVYSDADAGALHVQVADVAVSIGGTNAAESYLDVDKILAAAEASGAQAVHPGYGFLSENAAFARAVLEAGLIWIGPSPDAIDAMGDKAAAKQLMAQAGVPVLAGWMGEVEGVAAAAEEVGYPLLIKAVAGGGGRGMRTVREPGDLAEALASAQREAQAAFGNPTVMLERLLVGARHVEIQVLGDSHGQVMHVGERECSVQRRHQKVIEEAPSPAVDVDLRAAMGAAACAAAQAVSYEGAGTVEFLLEPDGSFWFLEMNTRLQVEHPITEEVWGCDLVDCQLGIAAGEALDELPQGPKVTEPRGHAIEVRLYAEDPGAGHLPQAGTIGYWEPPALRVDAGVRPGDAVSPYYDPMIAKVIAWGPTRERARRRLIGGLRGSPVLGLPTNGVFLVDVLEHADFASGEVDTAWLEATFADWAPGAVDPALSALGAVLLSVDDPAAATGWSSRGELGWPVLVPEPVRVSLVAGADGPRTYTVGEVSVDVLGLDEGEGSRAGPLPGSHAGGVRTGAGLPDRCGVLDCSIGGVRRRVQFARVGRTVHLGEPTLGLATLSTPDPLDRTPPDVVGDGRLRAPMSGRVVRVDAEVGGTVTQGDVLAVLEAMKMEHHLVADLSGAVVEVRVAAGDQVRPGDVLVVVEAAG
jgi:acetyl/propionyl-CoA carboxylase alpha subunit